MYPDLIKKLYALQQNGGVKLGLANMERLCRSFGNPERQFDTVHVAGTNGKGSVVTKVAKGYELSGRSAGLYTSPHISTFRERIKINGILISEKDVERLLIEIFKVVGKEEISATFFEITTLLCFLYFAEMKVDVAVLETGLGGRLDATNVISKPLASVITSIQYDHKELLGSTLEEIAKEKGGIIKKGSPVVIGPRVPLEVIGPIAEILQSPLHRVSGEFKSYDEENSAIARSVLEGLGFTEEVISGAMHALPPCRMEYVDGKAILDVAHNPDGIAHLFKSLPSRKYDVVLGLSKSKDCSECVRILKDHVNKLYLVCAQNGRGLETKVLKQMFLDVGFRGNVEEFASVESGVTTALKGCDAPILVCGSFFIMDAARQALGIQEERDFLNLN